MKSHFTLLFCFFSMIAFGQRGLFVPNGKTVTLAKNEKRIALVIGNDNYRGGGWEPLNNAANDAITMTAALQNVGFEVIKLTNATRSQMLSGIDALGQKITSTEMVALVFYAGHGIEADGINYWIPIDDRSECRIQMKANCIDIDYVNAYLKQKNAAFNILISDACRNNTIPFKCADINSRDKGTIGFVKYEPKGTCIAFSTASGKSASDGKGQSNSPYTAALAKALQVEGYKIEDVFKQVNRDLSDIGQEPWTNNAFSGDFYFRMPTPSVVVPPPPPPSVLKADFTEYGSGVSFTMKYLRGNTFQMGSSDSEAYESEKPVHSVSVGEFYMGKYEVTVGEYLKFCAATNSHFPEWLEIGNQYNVETGSDSYYRDKGYSRNSSSTLPIVGVSWDDAVAYCKWLSSMTGKTYRLPTEAEWEYAARGGQNYKYAGSDNLDAVAWHVGNSGGKTHPVGQKQSNGFGLYDMSGNVWEWCSDWYAADYYKNSPSQNPTGASSGSFRVLRGGSWYYDGQDCRSAFRSNGAPGNRSHNYGFRLVLVP